MKHGRQARPARRCPCRRRVPSSPRRDTECCFLDAQGPLHASRLQHAWCSGVVRARTDRCRAVPRRGAGGGESGDGNSLITLNLDIAIHDAILAISLLL